MLQRVVVFQKGAQVLAATPGVKIGQAVCCKTDIFDRETGIRLALLQGAVNTYGPVALHQYPVDFDGDGMLTHSYWVKYEQVIAAAMNFIANVTAHVALRLATGNVYGKHARSDQKIKSSASIEL